MKIPREQFSSTLMPFVSSVRERDRCSTRRRRISPNYSSLLETQEEYEDLGDHPDLESDAPTEYSPHETDSELSDDCEDDIVKNILNEHRYVGEDIVTSWNAHPSRPNV
ncbi:hypothetical protein QE152_g33394 [Popillia japonica]|uniref:Uncharacterized protein n=1 Tax=Popillia japonica TaxID=7064 RepID=A0AAW1IWV0_POPJA